MRISQVKQCRERRGAILSFVGVSLVSLIAVTGLVIDGGLLLVERRHAQNAADSAALAAAQDLLAGKSAALAKASAVEYAKAQGYTDKVNSASVTINIPPSNGPHIGDGNYVEALITRQITTLFIHVVSAPNSTAGARAVAGVEQGNPDPNSLVALAPHGDGSLLLTGSGTVKTGASVQVNSDGSQALKIQGSVSAKASAWNVNGGVNPASGSFSPAAHTGAAAIADPLAVIGAPNTSSMSTFPAVNLAGGQAQTLSPGIYTGGISASGSSSLTMQPGVYVIQGGGLTVSQSASMSAAGVMIYNTGTTSTFAPISITSSNATFSPPTSGQYQGMMIFQDRQNTQPVTVNDPQSGGLTGTFYVPGGRFTFNANGGQPHNMQVIAGQITMVTNTPQGNADIDLPYNSSQFARAATIYLVE